MKNVITIYVPVTRIDFLDETFTCLMKQSNLNYDVLVLDNTGYDKHTVADIYQKYFQRNPNARLIKTEQKIGNGDPTISWNYGFLHIDTPYFSMLGDDDMIAVNYVEEMLRLINENPSISIFRCRVHMINEKGKIIKYGQKLPPKISWDEYVYERTTYKLTQSTSEFCIKTQSLKAISGYQSYPYAIKSDDATYVSLMLQNDMVSTNDTCAYWRRHGNNLSMVVPYKIRISALKQYHFFIEKLLDKNQGCLNRELIQSVTKVYVFREILLVMKNKMYHNHWLRPIVKTLHNKGFLKSI